MISVLFSSLFGTVVLLPFIVTFLTLIIFKKMGRAPVSVIGITADITTFFLLLSVFFIARTIFGSGAGYVVFTIVIIVTIAFTIYERMKSKEFRILRLLRNAWRLLFILFAIAYVLLLMLGITLQIIDYVT